jgi:hypothetical protein
MYSLRNLFCLLLFATPVFVSAQIDDAKGLFRDLRSLDGVWFMSTDRGDRLEIWKRQNDSTLTGRDIRIKPENGDTVLLETLRMERRGNEIIFSVQSKTQNNNQPVAYSLTTADYDGYLFENATHEEIQKIRYNLLGNREVQVTTEGKRNNRPVKTEYVYEREFAPGAVEFRLRAGLNGQILRSTGNLISYGKPAFTWRPSWEVGTQVSFKGAGGFITINAELGLTGRSSHAKSDFAKITGKDVLGLDSFTVFKRDLTYNSIWLDMAVYPQITLKRDGKLSLLVGPYLGLLIGNIPKGTEEPANDNKLYKASNDLKTVALGLLVGFQYKVNFGKKDVGGILGVRANLGLSNIDNLYTKGTNNPAFYNGSVNFVGASVYYSVNLLKL